MKKTVLILPFILFHYLNLQAQSNSEKSILNIGDQAPKLEVGSWLKGSPTTTLIPGKIYVIEFWATWCLPCIAQFPHLSELAEKYKDKVVFNGISIREKEGTTMRTLQTFVNSKSEQMRYPVATDTEDGYMYRNWYQRAEPKGIPYAIVVGGDGRIAWKGNPAGIDKILSAITSGKFFIELAVIRAKEDARLNRIDDELCSKFNPYFTARDWKGLKKTVDSAVSKHPELKFRKITGNAGFIALARTKPTKAAEFVREWWAANDLPDWAAVANVVKPELEFPAELYLLAVEALEQQLKHYPWSMTELDTYRKISMLYAKAGKYELGEKANKKADSLEKGISRDHK